MSDADLTRKMFDAEVKAVGERTMRFVVSTGEPDRDNDTINPNGWRLTNYRKNPVVLWAHDARALPVARAVDVRVEDEKLIAVAEFPGREIFEFGATVFDLLKGGFLRATSVGFRPLKFVRNAEGGTDFHEQELVEFSICNVPSNPATLAMRGFDDATFKAWLRGEEPPPHARDVVLNVDEGEERARTGREAQVDGTLEDFKSAYREALTAHVRDAMRRLRTEPYEPVVALSREELRGILRDAARHGLREFVQAEVTAAVHRARGRVD